MSDTKEQAGTQLTPEQLEDVGGGSLCSAHEIVSLIEGLTRSYEGLIGFTSHVIERMVSGMKH